MKKLALFSVVLFLFGLVPAANAGFLIVDSYQDFIDACPTCKYDRLVENFEDTTLVPGLTINSTYPNAVIEDGVYKDLIDDGQGYNTTFSYTPPLYGFGGWFDLANPGGPGSNIKVTVDGNTVGEIPNTFIGNFWGFFTDDNSTFTDVLFSEGTGSGIQETYWSVDLALCATKPVPIPTAVLLLGSGLIGYVGIRRRKFMK